MYHNVTKTCMVAAWRTNATTGQWGCPALAVMSSRHCTCQGHRRCALHTHKNVCKKILMNANSAVALWTQLSSRQHPVVYVPTIAVMWKSHAQLQHFTDSTLAVSWATHKCNGCQMTTAQRMGTAHGFAEPLQKISASLLSWWGQHMVPQLEGESCVHVGVFTEWFSRKDLWGIVDYFGDHEQSLHEIVRHLWNFLVVY